MSRRRLMFNHMVEQSPALDSVFRALSDPTRRAMLTALETAPRSVSELAAPFAISLAGASKHVRVLEEAGLVRREKRGREQRCQLTPAPLKAAAAWLARYERFCTQRLDALERALGADGACDTGEAAND